MARSQSVGVVDINGPMTQDPSSSVIFPPQWLGREKLHDEICMKYNSKQALSIVIWIIHVELTQQKIARSENSFPLSTRIRICPDKMDFASRYLYSSSNWIRTPYNFDNQVRVNHEIESRHAGNTNSEKELPGPGSTAPNPEVLD